MVSAKAEFLEMNLDCVAAVSMKSVRRVFFPEFV